MTDTQTILACPACGYTAAVYDYQAMSAVYCEDCGAMGPLGETDYEAIELWNAMPRRPQWTENIPQEEGFYLYKEKYGDRVRVRSVFRLSGELYTLSEDGFEQIPAERMPGRWAGPIGLPAE